MGFKNTFEIITKDIQDIEKLVGNFKNYSEIPRIELDLALSKLRNVYDILLIIKEETPEIMPEAHTEMKEIIEKQPEQEFIPENTEEELINVENTSPDHETISHSVPNELKKQKKIIAESFENEKEFINEKLSSVNTKNDVSSRLQSSPIQSIAGSIGINDKFLFIRELFSGNPENFRNTLDILDHTKSMDDAMNYLKTNFNWDMEDETVKQLVVLIRRKFISLKNE